MFGCAQTPFRTIAAATVTRRCATFRPLWARVFVCGPARSEATGRPAALAKAPLKSLPTRQPARNRLPGRPRTIFLSPSWLRALLAVPRNTGALLFEAGKKGRATVGGNGRPGAWANGGETVSRHGARRVTQRLCRGATREGLGWGATTEVPAMRFTSNTLRLCLPPRKPSMNQWFHSPSTSVLRPDFAQRRKPVWAALAVQVDLFTKSPPQQRRHWPCDCHLIEQPVPA